MAIKDYLWVEKYRPTHVKDIVLPAKFSKFFGDIVKNGETPNLLLHSSVPGSGKTALSKALVNDLNADHLYINISSESGIDTLRGSISNFAMTKSITMRPKVVIMDECLHENEKIRVGTVNDWKAVALKDLEKDTAYPIVSMNMETMELENDYGCVVSDKTDELYEVKTGSGKTIILNSKHPFIVNGENGKLSQKSIDDGLSIGEHIFIAYRERPIILATMIGDDRVKSINKIGTGRVINLTVQKNHTFITENGIVTHNCDGATAQLQAGLRAAIEEYHRHCRFILTCNYISKIIPPLREGRVMQFDFNMTDNATREEMIPKVLRRLEGILNNENIEYDKDTLKKLVERDYPSIRKMVSTLQKFSSMYGHIGPELITTTIVDDKLYALVNAKKFSEAREMIIKNNYDIGELYPAFYRDFVPTLKGMAEQCPTILTLAKYQAQHPNAIDPELNFAACLLEIIQGLIEARGN